MKQQFDLTLEELFKVQVGEPEEAPTEMVASIWRSWKKPLGQLADDEIGRLILQQDGFPYVLDVVWPKLLADPLFDGGYYPGDVLPFLLRAEANAFKDRPEYRADLEQLKQRAL